jgi:hypothetical protein
VDGIGNAGIHAVACVRHPQMGSVACYEDMAISEPIGDQTSTDPIFFADDAVLKRLINAQDVANRCIAIHRIKLRFVRVQVVVPAFSAFRKEAAWQEREEIRGETSRAPRAENFRFTTSL